MRRPSPELRVENPTSRGPTLDEKLAARRAARAQELAARRARRAARRELLAARVRLQRIRAREKVRQGAFLLPSLLTVGSVFLSFWAIISIFNRGGKLFLGPTATQQDVFVLAAWLLFAAF